MSSAGGGTLCTRAAPCDDFIATHNATNAGGEIRCLDSGPFSGGTLTKSITIDCAGVGAVTSVLIVNGAGIVAKFRNLTFSGIFGNTDGIITINGAATIVDNCVFENYVLGVAIAIRFRPSAAGSQLVVTDTSITNNGVGAAGGGIVVNPQAGGSAVVLLDRVTVASNVYGIVADGTGSTGGIAMTIANSDVHRNAQDGIVATTPAGGAPIGMMIKNTRSLSNAIGIRATGAGVTVRADSTTVSNNGTGLVVNLGASLLSFGNNNVEANGTNGAFSGSVALK